MPRSKVVHPHSFFPNGWSPEAPLLGVPFSFNTRFQKRLEDVGVIWGNDFVVDREPSQPTLADGGDTKKVEFKFKSDDAYQKALAIYNDMFGDDNVMYENVISDEEVLKEFNYRSIVPKLYHKTMSALGSNKAGGRLQLSQTTDQLMGEFNTFLGHQGGKPNWANVLKFLTQKFGEDTAVALAKTLAKPGAAGRNLINKNANAQAAAPAGDTADTGAPAADATAPGAAPGAAPGQKFKSPKLNNMYNDAIGRQKAVQGDKDFYSKKAAAAGTNSAAKPYQNNTFKQLNDLVSQPKPDVKQIMNLTREIYRHAQDYGGQDKARVAAYLKNLRNNPKVYSTPALAQMFSGLKLESINRVLDMAIYLVENSITTKQGLTEAYSRFFLTEKPFGRRIDPNSTKPAYDNGADNPSFGRKAAPQAAPQAAAQPAAPAGNPAAPGAAGLRARAAARGIGGGGGSVPPVQPPSNGEASPDPSAEPEQNSQQSFGKPPNSVYSRKELYSMFQLIAKGLLANGLVDFPSGNDSTYYRKGANGRYQAVTEPSIGKTINSAPAQKGAAPAAAAPRTIDPTTFAGNLRALRANTPDANVVSDLVRKGYSRNDIIKQLRASKTQINPDVLQALDDAAAGRRSQ